jgi:hypothetical protein
LFEAKSPFENLVDFGIVHIKSKATKFFFLTNDQELSAHWKISHVKNVFKKLTNLHLKTKQDLENISSIDDASVFDFSVSEGTLTGPSIPVKSFPSTLALPSNFTDTINQS